MRGDEPEFLYPKGSDKKCTPHAQVNFYLGISIGNKNGSGNLPDPSFFPNVLVPIFRPIHSVNPPMKRTGDAQLAFPPPDMEPQSTLLLVTFTRTRNFFPRRTRS